MKKPQLSMISVLLISLSLTACTTAERQALDAANDQGKLQAAKELPAYPADCRRTERSGVRKAERLDVALLRTDQALGRQNARTKRCEAWYDKVKTETSAQ